jgi:hypothetical protein
VIEKKADNGNYVYVFYLTRVNGITFANNCLETKDDPICSRCTPIMKYHVRVPKVVSFDVMKAVTTQF